MPSRKTMTKLGQYRRFLSMAVLLAIAFAGLGYRLVDLQVLQHEQIRSQAARRTERTLVRAARRGNILDANQTLLAGSQFVKTVCADPTLIGTNQAAMARLLAPILQLDVAWLNQRLQPSYFTNEQGQKRAQQYVVLKNKVSTEDWDRVRETMRRFGAVPDEKRLPRAEQAALRALRNSAIYTAPLDDQLRFYPHGSLAAHVLGFVSTEEYRTNQQVLVETVGRYGVELTQNNSLTGVAGWRETEVLRSREVSTFRSQDVDPRNGHNVVLTIDAGVQHILETELIEAVQKYSPVGASGIVIRPRTGDIVAMAALPTFNPNKPGDYPMDALRNRAISDIYEPGSTFKIVTIAGALNDGMVSLDSQYDCDHGHFYFANHRLKDDHPLGLASIADIVAKSSNIGTAKVGLQLGKNRVYQYARGFGFGAQTGIDLKGEVRGIVDPAGKWSQLQSSRVPIGQGVAVTPLQMVMAMSAIANGGRLMQPRLIDCYLDENGQEILRTPSRVVNQVISESAARQMVAALKRVVSSNGTAIKATMEHYTVAGKTGTAEKPGRGGYIHGKYVASFEGFFPADNPELCIGIMLDDPKPVYYGGLTAAPTFRNIAERTAKFLAIKPDPAGVETQVASAGTNRPSGVPPAF